MAEKLEVKELAEVAVRFSGDSGDGMQLVGNIFSTVSATVYQYVSRLSRRYPCPARFTDRCERFSGTHRCRYGIYPRR